MAKQLIEKIIVAINGTEQSFNAAYYGIMMAKQYKCQMKAVYVVDSETLKRLTFSKFFVSEESKLYEDALKNEGQKNLDYVEKAAKSKGVKIEKELRSGSVWSEIIKSASEYEADVILLGGKNHEKRVSSNVAKYDVLSMTYREVLSNASCNVLIVSESDLDKKFAKI